MDHGQWPRHAKVAEVSADDIDALHRKITKATPYRANRVVSLLSKMFSLAIRWRWRLDNPCKGVSHNPENKRRRYLTAAEIERLTVALAAYGDQSAANAIRLPASDRRYAVARRWRQNGPISISSRAFGRSLLTQRKRQPSIASH